MDRQTRRDFVKLGAATTAVGLTAVVSSADVTAQDDDWIVAESPTEEALNDAVATAHGPFAAGADGNVVARGDDGWELAVEYGPQARSRRLTGIDATDDGAAVWFVGGSGVIGEYDVETRTLTNYSAPNGMTSTWEDCAVRGNAGEDERLYFVNGSGELLVGVRQDSGAVQYADVVEPGGGSTIPAVDFHERQNGHVCSTSQFVAETEDGGDSWEQIGIDFAGSEFFDLASVGARDVNVASGAGIVYRYDGFRWTPHVVDDGRRAIRAVDRDGAEGLAAGDAGLVYERQSAGQWRRMETPVETELTGVARGETVDVAVGTGGVIVERERGSTDDGAVDDGDAEDNTSAVAASPAIGTAESLTVESYEEGEWVFPDGG